MTSDQEDRPAPPGVDTSFPHSARMYDYWLGGSSNFAADRALGQAFEQAIPSIRTMAKENRKFLGRAVRYMVQEEGIRQFLDIGSGIPADGDTHSVTRIVAPDARIVCVDHDPIVHAHAGQLRAADPDYFDGGPGRTVHLEGDLSKPADLLGDPVLNDVLDLSKPVGLLLVAVLMLIGDEDDPWASTRSLLDALPPGSVVAVTHPSQDFNPTAMAEVAAAAAQGRMTLVPRGRDEVARFFEGWELVEPGLAPVMGWRPDGELPADPNAAYYWAGAARKPA